MNGRNGWLERPPIQPDEGIAATVLAGWAALLILPVDIFGLGRGFGTMRETAREEVWGVVAVVILYTFLAGVVFHHRILHLAGLALMASWWLFVAGMIFDANGHTIGTGTLTYGVIGVACLARVYARSVSWAGR